MLAFTGEIRERMHEHNDKKYIRVYVPPKVAEYITSIEKKNVYKLSKDAFVYQDFFQDTLVVKVPFRYRRVMCPVTGAKPVQSLEVGDKVDVEITYTGVWTAGNYTGHSWKIKNIHTY